ncbi:MAG: hypothetical protein C0410_08310 [Anaerolinea sp.]|nr:hypothetical protein [Anaerolinea sp.]
MFLVPFLSSLYSRFLTSVPKQVFFPTKNPLFSGLFDDLLGLPPTKEKEPGFIGRDNIVISQFRI